MKQANSNLWWIIIGGVIALVVMVILLIAFQGKNSMLDASFLSCEGKGGICTTASSCASQGGSVASGFTCPEKNIAGLDPADKEKCCI